MKYTWVLLLFCLAGFSFAQPTSSKIFPPQGSMIDIGGFRLHALVAGKKYAAQKGTVVFFAGAGDVSLFWDLVLPEVGQFACAVAIDPNGMAWSEHGHNKSLMQETADAYQLLKVGNFSPPFILVGHSLGGIRALLFAKEYNEEVNGLILVDGTHPDVVLKVFDPKEKKASWKKFRTTANNNIPEIIWTPLSSPPKLDTLFIQRDFGKLLRNFSPETQQKIKWLYNQKPYTYVKGKGDDYSAEIFQYIFENPKKFHLGNKPLIVISGGKKHKPKGDENWSTKALINHRKKLQKALLNYADNSSHIVAKKSGHHIHIDQPEIIINAIKELIGK